MFESEDAVIRDLENLFLEVCKIDPSADLCRENNMWAVGLYHDNMGSNEAVFGISIEDALNNALKQLKDCSPENYHEDKELDAALLKRMKS